MKKEKISLRQKAGEGWDSFHKWFDKQSMYNKFIYLRDVGLDYDNKQQMQQAANAIGVDEDDYAPIVFAKLRNANMGNVAQDIYKHGTNIVNKGLETGKKAVQQVQKYTNDYLDDRAARRSLDDAIERLRIEFHNEIDKTFKKKNDNNLGFGKNLSPNINSQTISRQGLCSYNSYPANSKNEVQKFYIDDEVDEDEKFLENLIGQGLYGLDGEGECYAIEIPINTIYTDETRFQNRQTAFNEMSANQVANFYNKNRFDPIVVWVDPSDNLTYVLSGHSRLAGMIQRGEENIAVRYFNGNEGEAIQFARIESNRLANQENLIEDIKAYKLARDGNDKTNTPPLTKKAIKELFKGKWILLENLTYLDPDGKFMRALNVEPDLYPYIRIRAGWTGAIRKEHPQLTNIHESDIFNFLYMDKKNILLKHDDFIKIVEDRIRLGKDRLFPECGDNGCEQIKEASEILRSREEKELYKEIEKLDETISVMKSRFKSNKDASKIWTEEEKEAIREVLRQYEADREKLRIRLGLSEKKRDAMDMFRL